LALIGCGGGGGGGRLGENKGKTLALKFVLPIAGEHPPE